MRVWKRYLFYNAMTWPVVTAVYSPYYIVWLQFSGMQILRWLATSLAMGIAANFAIMPVVTRVVRWLDRRPE